jgi:hypothetical protein
VAELPSGTLTFLFTDVEPGSRLRRNLRQACKEFGVTFARIVQTHDCLPGKGDQ